MMAPGTDLVALALRDPTALSGFSLPDWDLLVRQARTSGLLVRLAHQLGSGGLMHIVPAPVLPHLVASRIVARQQAEEAQREVRHLLQALRPIAVDVILLKGAAYLMAGLPPGAARLFSDIDILVPKAELGSVEALLMSLGWATTHHDPYDQRYYRVWMHELPPLHHVRRRTVLDVHHAILPETARLKPASKLLIAAAVAVPGHPGLRVLAPADMVLHSMSHLFHNEELSHGLRDLSDIDLLLRHFGADPGFWPTLVLRSVELDLTRPLFYGLRYARLVLGTPIPQATLDSAAPFAPPTLMARWMDALWLRGLRTPHPTTDDAGTPLARFLLYVRAHFLRMPAGLLLRHLAIKAWRRRVTAQPEEVAQPGV